MAVITEEPEPQSTLKKPTSPPEVSETQKKNPFIFWFYFTLLVSFITLLTVTLSSLTSSSQDPKSFFLSLSAPLRQHYSRGRIIKVQIAKSQQHTEIFALESGNKPSVTEKVLIVHGLGLSSFSFRKVIDFLGSRGLHGVVFDLPGNGFSDKTMEVVEERGSGVFEKLLDVYGLIKEKGIFWAFDNVIETGQIPYEEIQSHFDRGKNVVKSIALGGEEMGRILGQVISTMGLAPVHLVLHDSSLGMVSNWILENAESVRSVSLVDTSVKPALPLWVLEIPLVREVVLGSTLAFKRLIGLCCSKGISGMDVDAHRVILKGKNGREALVRTLKKLNSSFNVVEWGRSDVIRKLPMQVIWSSDWSKEWSKEGLKVVEALQRGKLVTHSSGRWPQEDAADELAERISHFVSSLPKSVRQVDEESIPEQIQKIVDETKENMNVNHQHHHHHHHHHHGHSHGHTADYMNAYGLGPGWGS
ncbi:hypothetical protein K2173_000658 [Erythroxylum novogranatense]|uniref:AB hydrolase-1 domain-containing protein n=1 Tax=Erythroxylum novogranatense TaxID=1862640 RepID=A0AAV8SI33_9ROSI|nr:hypothetical protein K2173_000658 [Erythroxylum novogranatense]